MIVVGEEGPDAFGWVEGKLPSDGPLLEVLECVFEALDDVVG